MYYIYIIYIIYVYIRKYICSQKDKQYALPVITNPPMTLW